MAAIGQALRLQVFVGLWQAVTALIGSCPTLSPSPYLGEASPFGWPLSPNDWTFVQQEDWPQRYMICGGKRQSPMDITSSGSCLTTGGQDGLLLSKSDYSKVARGMVGVSSYMRSAVVKGDFGSLYLQDASGQPVQYTAHEVHLSADSWHSMDGQSRVAEMMIFHKPKGQADMLKSGVVVSVLFEHNESADSSIFNYMGFPKGKEELEVSGGEWPSLTDGLDLAETMKEVGSGPSYMYEGSVPVPPCHETVKYVVLGKALHVHPAQTAKLKEALGCLAGGYKKRNPVANHPWECRRVFKNSLPAGGSHFEETCKEAWENGNWYRAAHCWDHEVAQSCVASPIDLDASKAGDFSGSSWETAVKFVAGPAQSVTVKPSDFTLDAVPTSLGVSGSTPNFGSIIVQGRNFLLHKISVKAISSHSYQGKRHVGEIQVEGIMDGDGMKKLSDVSPVHSSHASHSEEHRHLAADVQEDHRVILSFPLQLGDDNILLDELGLPVAKYRQKIVDGVEYTRNGVDIQHLLQATNGNWFWYRGGLVVPGCPDWGARWLIFETPLSVSLPQLNFLSLKVSGPDSTRLFGPSMNAATYKAAVGLKSMPKMAVDKHGTCPDEEWNYDNPSCWAEKHSICSKGERQSPIDIGRSSVKTVGKDNFLAICSWRPVKYLHVVNFGKGLAVPGDQLGYLTFTGEDGFPQYFQVAQIQLHMPSEHFIDSHGYGAELQIVHRNQQTVTQNVNSNKSSPFVTTSFFFEIGEKESTLLKLLFLPGILEPETYRVLPQSLDLMRHLGPALDGDYYTYDGSSTSPDCHEYNKWFIFDHAFSMSMDQFVAFKAMFPSPGNNRPLQRYKSHHLVKNSLEDGEPKHFDFFLGRHTARNRFFAGEAYILVPIGATLSLMCVIMSAILVRDWVATKKSISGMAEMIGKSVGGRV